jgi:hypothetical protein
MRWVRKIVCSAIFSPIFHGIGCIVVTADKAIVGDDPVVICLSNCGNVRHETLLCCVAVAVDYSEKKFGVRHHQKRNLSSQHSLQVMFQNKCVIKLVREIPCLRSHAGSRNPP